MSEGDEKNNSISSGSANSSPSSLSNNSATSSQRRMTTFEELIEDITNRRKTTFHDEHDQTITCMDEDELDENFDLNEDRIYNEEYDALAEHRRLLSKLSPRCLRSLIKLDEVFKKTPNKDGAASRLYKELRDIYNSERYKNGSISIDLQYNNLFRWNYTVKFDDECSPLYKDLKMIKDQNRGDGLLRFNIGFPETYPFASPIVLMTSPQIGGSLQYPKDWFRLLHKEWSCHQIVDQIMIEIVKLVSRERVDDCLTYPSTEIAFLRLQRDHQRRGDAPRFRLLSQFRSSLLRFRPLTSQQQQQQLAQEPSLNPSQIDFNQSANRSRLGELQSRRLRVVREARLRMRLLSQPLQQQHSFHPPVYLLQSNPDELELEQSSQANQSFMSINQSNRQFESHERSSDASLHSFEHRLEMNLSQQQNDLHLLDREFERLNQSLDILRSSALSPPRHRDSSNQQREPQDLSSSLPQPENQQLRQLLHLLQRVQPQQSGARGDEESRQPIDQQFQQLPLQLQQLDHSQSRNLIQQLQAIIRDLP